MAKRLGHRNTAQVSRWENGAKTPTLDNALMLGHILKAPVEVLFADRAAGLDALALSHENEGDGEGALALRLEALRISPSVARGRVLPRVARRN